MHSFASVIPDDSCRRCGARVVVTLWQLVDVEERPDLLVRLLDGTIDDVLCGECGAVAQQRLPLVVYRPSEQPRLILSMPGLAISDGERAAALRLLDRLPEAPPAAIPEVPRDLLPLALIGEMAAVESALAERRRRSAALGRHLTHLVNLKSRTRALRWVGRHPELMGDEADRILERHVREAERAGDTRRHEHFQRSLQLVRVCRQNGVEAVIARLGRPLSEDDAARLERLLAELDENPRRLRLCREILALLPSDRTDGTLAALEGAMRMNVAALTIDGADFELELAIDALEEALELETQRTSRSRLRRALGDALLARRRGDRADNVERAIKAFEAALRRSPQEERAWTLARLGAARSESARGRPAARIDRAIRELREAIDPLAGPQRAAATRDLAVALQRRHADRAEAQEEAIDLLRGLARSEARLGDRFEWATTTFALGNAHARRRRGDREANLRRAIAAYRRALRVFTPEDTPLAWAMAMTGLGAALADRSETAGRAATRDEIACYESALGVLSPIATPYEWAMTVMNLGVTLKRSGRPASTDDAIERFEQAAEILTRAREPVAWAQLMDNLGTAYRRRASGDAEENRVTAERRYGQALEVFTPAFLPDECRAVARNLGDLHAECGAWPVARRAYRLGVRAAEAVHRMASVPASRLVEAETNADLYDRAVDACLRVRGPRSRREALLHAEAGKGRAFLDRVGESDLPSPAGAPPALLARERDLITRLRETAQELDEPHLPDAAARRIAARRRGLAGELADIWSELETRSAAAREYVALRRAASPTWDDLARLAERLGPSTAVVELYTLPARIAAFVLRAGGDAPAVYESPVSADELLYRYVRPYEDEMLERLRLERAGRRATGDWLELGERLLAPLAGALEGADLVYLVPHGRLHLLPLHALSCGGRPFIADRSVAYAPSAGALIRVLDRSSAAGGADLVLGYTPHAAERRLFHGEARTVARMLSCKPLVGGRARAAAVRRRGPHAGRIHLSCHGSFDAHDPLASKVELADGPLTARDWMRLDLQADLVTLSACQTAVSQVGRGDELTGLMCALLSAGASSVLVTLWSVDAEAAASWIDDFYGRITGAARQTKAAAARAATLCLMDDGADPYLWAPFVLVGDAE